MRDSAIAGESQPHKETTAAAAANPRALRCANLTAASNGTAVADSDFTGPGLLSELNRSSDKGFRINNF